LDSARYHFIGRISYRGGGGSQHVRITFFTGPNENGYTFFGTPRR
jgi:hypothetical protein